MNTQYRKNLKAVLEASKSYCDESINNLKWELGTYDLSIDSDTTTAYQKTIPSGAIDCMVNVLGGMSYKCNNLWSYGDTGKTASETTWHEINISTNILKAGTYTISAIVSTTDTSASGVRIAFRNSTKGSITAINSLPVGNNRTPQTFTLTEDCYYIFVYANATTNPNEYVSTITDIMLNEGSTALPYEPYFDGIRDSAISSIVSKDSNNTTLDTLTIDNNIQALEGYGWGINDTCYNYIDFENKKFIQKAARVDLGSLNWVYDEGQSRFYFIDNTNILGAKFPVQSQTINNIKIAKDYTRVSYQSIYTAPYTDKVIAGANITNVNYLSIRDNTYTTAEAFKTAMNGIYLYYELATPVETDISQYLDNNEITIEANGTLTFTNTYNQAVPSDIDYLIEEVKA